MAMLFATAGVERPSKEFGPLYASARPSDPVIRCSADLTLLALAVACRDIDVRNVKALIIGPHETPYEFGFFEVCSLLLMKAMSSPLT